MGLQTTEMDIGKYYEYIPNIATFLPTIKYLCRVDAQDNCYEFDEERGEWRFRSVLSAFFWDDTTELFTAIPEEDLPFTARPPGLSGCPRLVWRRGACVLTDKVQPGDLPYTF